MQILTHFGLALNQARVYIALARLGRASDAKTISKVSMVAREHVYRILPRLQEAGLVEKVIVRPIHFRAVPIEDAFLILYKQRTRETSQLQEKTRDFLNKFKQNQIEITLQETSPQFVLIPKGEVSIKKRRNEIEGAQTSIEFITSWKRFPRTVKFFAESGRKALKRNVKMRVILEKPPKEAFLPEKIDEFKKYPNYEIRYTPNSPLAIVGVFDKTRALIKTSASVGLAEASSLWTNNPCIVSIIQDYFEILWITAMETPCYNIDEDQV
ncbi:MAG: hypothetical protein NWE80_00855 [Candidatus Bathyarchaeota archaeon]|nr:hypothetical protein [Candidatus Bathyarchaeota archaeon]